MKSLVKFTAVYMVLLFAFACAPKSLVAPVVTQTPESVPTTYPTPTSTPSPSPRATPLISEEDSIILDQQFHDFLNKEGEYTQEKISSIVLDIDVTGDESFGLGLTDPVPRIQGYYFNCVDTGDYIILLFGFDGADGNRFITPIRISAYFYDFIQKRKFLVDRFYENSIDMWHFAGTSEATIYYSRNDIYQFFKEHTGIIMGLELCKQKFEIDDRVKGLGEIAISFVNSLNVSTDFTYGLFQLVESNGIQFEVPLEVNPNSTDIIQIINAKDIQQMDSSVIPEVFNVGYYGG
ncbi:MAG: hypothetical protein VB068_09840 [Petrimonas sp.]|nr:hypothetical protein [Petrimonas sp.]